MENNVTELLDKITQHLKEMARTETIIGEEFTMGEYQCKPVIKIGTGFVSGSGTGEDPKGKACGTGTGGGAGIGISPVGFLVSKKDEISFISAERNKGLNTLFEKIPDIIEKAMEFKEKKEGKESKEDKKSK
ncbi:MAG: hypothetical protein JW801_06720 [Bacteroidales bacterium]|nr:hypothetical protein [Bacteroidales bacterium]